jgi:hypothetical protein
MILHGSDSDIKEACIFQMLYNEINEDAVFPTDIEPNFQLLRYINNQYKQSLLTKLKGVIPHKCKNKIKKLIRKSIMLYKITLFNLNFDEK